jgi:SAM-dependent methyltransferase
VVAFTGERISAHDEDFQPDLSQHMAAYRACLPFVPGKVVLDGGCGEGYGAKCIAESARLVIGVDSSWETAREAGRGAPRNLHLSCSDLRRLGFQDGSFDVVCCFQVVGTFDIRSRSCGERLACCDRKDSSFSPLRIGLPRSRRTPITSKSIGPRSSGSS